jgi:hypothetical protein
MSGMHTKKQEQKSKCILSLEALNLGRWKDIPYSLAKLCMDYDLPAYDGIRDLQMF